MEVRKLGGTSEFLSRAFLIHDSISDVLTSGTYLCLAAGNHEIAEHLLSIKVARMS